jgi:hypothetical protein
MPSDYDMLVAEVSVRTWMTVMLGLWIAASGCDRSSTTSTTSPATQQVAATTPTTTATTEPALAYIWVDDRMYQFPPAKVIVKNKDDQAMALLFSDDPPEAINDNYTGNSFYLELTDLESPEPGKLAGASWGYKAPNSERAESVSGIFLQGRHSHLQPFDVRIQFEGGESRSTVRMAGTFLQFDDDELKAPGKLVNVRAVLSAEVGSKSKQK